MINFSIQEHLFVELKLQINPYDIDIAGHVNNVVYIRWFEDMRTRLFEKYLNLQKLISNDLYPVVVSTNIVYKKALRLFDEPIGYIDLVGNNHSILILRIEIKIKDKIAAIGEQKCVIMNLISGKMDKEKTKAILKFLNTKEQVLETNISN